MGQTPILFSLPSLSLLVPPEKVGAFPLSQDWIPVDPSTCEWKLGGGGDKRNLGPATASPSLAPPQYPILSSTVTTTTSAFCTRPRGNGSPTSSTSTNWCWLITLSSMWGWPGALFPRAPLQCHRAAAISASLLRRPPRCCPPPRIPALHQLVLHRPLLSSLLWLLDAWAEALSATAVMAPQSWRSLLGRTPGRDHLALRSWVPSEGPHWPASHMTLVSSVSILGPGVVLNP